MENIVIARDNGSDGVFLINHSITVSALLCIAAEVSARFDGFPVGVNLLGVMPLQVLLLLDKPMYAGISMIWCDNAYVETPYCLRVKTQRDRFKHKDYFGGVAFKHQEECRRELAEQCSDAVTRAGLQYVTTSGDATGVPPSVEKITTMSRAVRSRGGKLAIASGMTAGNIAAYAGLADAFLVASSVSLDFERLDAEKVAEFSDALRQYGVQ